MESEVGESRNPSFFYKYANKKLKSFPTIPPILTETNEMAIDNYHKANTFNEFFKSVFINDDGKPLNLTVRVPQEKRLRHLIISSAQIVKTINSIPHKGTQTPGNFPGILLKRILPSIKHFLFLLYNLSLIFGQIPSQWKCAFVSRLYIERDHKIYHRTIAL